MHLHITEQEHPNFGFGTKAEIDIPYQTEPAKSIAHEAYAHPHSWRGKSNVELLRHFLTKYCPNVEVIDKCLTEMQLIGYFITKM